MERYGAGSIVVSDYDPNWPALFEQESIRIGKALGSFALAIEHVGSTAVPGLPAKPIIDLSVGVASLEEASGRCIGPIEKLGYVHMPEYASWLPGELFFRKGPPGPWTHHVHLMEPSHPRWEALLVFRDYLRAHPAACLRYAEAKRASVRRWSDDGWAYTEAKTAVVLDILEQAQDWAAATGRAAL